MAEACERTMFGDAPVLSAAGSRRNFQRRRQRHLLRLRAGHTVWGTGTPLTRSKVGPPPGLDPYAWPEAHVEIDYDTFAFDLIDNDITFPPVTREVAISTDITHCDASCMAGAWFSISDPLATATPLAATWTCLATWVLMVTMLLLTTAIWVFAVPSILLTTAIWVFAIPSTPSTATTP